MTSIDAHQHFWDPEELTYDWLTPDMGPIYRRFGPEDLLPLMAATGLDRTVLVQSADHRADTDAMLRLADRHPEIAGVVGWVPIEMPEVAAEDLATLGTHEAFVGVRTLIHDQPDPDYLLRADVDEGLGVLEAADVPFDVVAVLPRHLEHVPTISERHPGLRLVLDHLAKPPVGTDDGGRWARLLARAAENPLVHAKVSGLYPAVGEPTAWTAADLRPHLHHALEVFGPDRLMFGSDWPISVLHGGWVRVWEELSLLFDELAEHERAAVMGGTAARFYRIPQQRLAT